MRKTEIKRIDFSKCRYANEIHAEIKNALNFPEHYGENLDALWDCLWEYYDCPVLIEIYGFNSAVQEIREELKGIIRIFDRGAELLKGFKYKIMS